MVHSKCQDYNKKISASNITKYRKIIYDKFSKFKNSVSNVSSRDLQKMFELYDHCFFQSSISEFIEQSHFVLQFKTTGEPTFTTEGTCTSKKCKYVVTIPTHHFNKVNGITNVAGHLCKDQLECLQRVLEHEIVHLIVFIFCNDTFMTDHHGTLFMKIAKNVFAHTDHRHYIF